MDILIKQEIEGDDNNFVFAMHHLLPPQNQDGLSRNKYLIKCCLSIKGALLYYLPSEYQDDESMVKIAMRQNPAAFQFASSRIRSKLSFVKRAVSKSQDMLGYVEGNHLKDKKTVIQLAKLNPAIASSYEVSVWNDDKDFGMVLIKQAFPYNNIRFLSERLIDDEDICKTSVKYSSLSFKYCSERLKASKVFCLFAIKKNYLNIFDVKNEELKSDKLFIRKLITKHSFLVLAGASSDLIRNKDLLSMAVNKSPFTVSYFLEKELNDDYELGEYIKSLFSNLSQKSLLSNLELLDKEFRFGGKTSEISNYKRATEWLISSIDVKHLKKYEGIALNRSGVITDEIQRRKIESITKQDMPQEYNDIVLSMTPKRSRKVLGSMKPERDHVTSMMKTIY